MQLFPTLVTLRSPPLRKGVEAVLPPLYFLITGFMATSLYPESRALCGEEVEIGRELERGLSFRCNSYFVFFWGTFTLWAVGVKTKPPFNENLYIKLPVAAVYTDVGKYSVLCKCLLAVSIQGNPKQYFVSVIMFKIHFL